MSNIKYNLKFMNKDEAYKRIQNILQASPSPVIVLGSGASAPYKIASMSDLADSLRVLFSKKKYTNNDSIKCVKDFLQNLDKRMGLEEALLDLRVTEEVEHDIIINVWNLIVRQDRKLLYNFATGKCTFELTKLFDRLIYGRDDSVMNVVTTNYDRIAEYAASKTEAFINTGFSHSYCGSIKPKLDAYPNKLKNSYIGKINIWKVHGSLDWFSKDGTTYYLPGINDIPDGYVPCIITPGTNKYEKTSQEPHRSLLSHIDEDFLNASGFVCIGYGFNDRHVHPKLLSAAKKRKLPILIITMEITDSIQRNVMTGEYNFTAIYSDGKNGTIIKTNDKRIIISDEELWKLDNLCKII